MSPTDPPTLSRREREILDLIYTRGEASAQQVMDDMADAPSYSAVRGLIRVLVEKGHLKVRSEGRRNLYRPTRAKRVAGKKAMERALDTFFGGNVGDAVAALLDVAPGGLPPAERDRLLAMIEEARKEGR